MTVTIIGYEEKVNLEGKPFFVLILEGGIEMIRSSMTGMYYATTKTARITSTFDKETCKRLIGTQIPGNIEKVEVEPYEFTDPETGEVKELHHRWAYVPSTDSKEDMELDVLGIPRRKAE